MDEGDRLPFAKARRTMPVRHAAIVDFPLGRLVDARQRLDQGGLAGAVFAEQRQDLAPAQVQGHAAQRQRAAEAFDDAIKSDERDVRVPIAARHGIPPKTIAVCSILYVE